MCRFVFAALALSLLAACGRPSTLPDFSGIWRLDASRTVLQTPSPDSSVFTIEHREPRFHLSRIHYFGEESDTFSINLTTDGVEMEHGYPNFQLKGRAYWDGEVLVFDSQLMMDGDSGTNVVRYSLADNGRTFMADEHQVMGQISHENKWVFERR